MKQTSWKYVLMGCAILFFAATITVSADEEAPQGKGKGKAVVGGKGAPGVAGKGKGAAPIQLPPGLAKKPLNHPGVVAWMKAHAGKGVPGAPKKAASYQPMEKKGKGSAVASSNVPGASKKAASYQPMEKKGKGSAVASSNLDQRLDQLLREIEDLRRQIRKRN